MNTLTTETPIQRLLSRLDGVRATSPERFVARCPAHADKDPSLSIRVTVDGTALIRCWAGCDTADVLAAVDLTFRDLFVQDPGRPPANSRPRPNAAALAEVEHARAVLRIAAADLDRGREHGPQDRAAIARAIARLTRNPGGQEVQHGHSV